MTEKDARSLRASEKETANPDWEQIGQRLASIRGSKSQPEMARELGVSKTTYGRWERGVRELGADGLRKLCWKGWNPTWILVGGGLPRRLTDMPWMADDRPATQVEGVLRKTASDKGSQPVRAQDAAMELGLLTTAVRITEEVLSKLGIRQQVSSDQFAELVRITFRDLARGAAEDAAGEALDRILAIARKPQTE